MGIRERFLSAMRRKSGGYIPKDISLTPPQLDRFEAFYGHRDYASEWRIPVRSVSLPFPKTHDGNLGWLGSISARTTVDSWGIGHEKARDGSHFERLIHPLASAEREDQVRAYPFPLPADDQSVHSAKEAVKALQGNDFVVTIAVSPVGGTIFWPAYKLRGMENLLCDMIDNEPLATELFNRVTAICTEQARLAASCEPDLIHLADDLGTQLSTYMSPELFRRWIKPGLAAVIRSAKTVHPAVLISFHSDGAMQSFIPDLIEIGVDILNPIQPECMEPSDIKNHYGDVLSLYGCIGTQTTMPFGTPDEVRRLTFQCCDKLGSNGGLWIAPTHVIEPEVPWENILAFIEAASQFE
ncbi:MAG: uroporphyrinogen decarboxylase family protein [Bacillota bacterium]|nr:uroporphyrinogen decarboxylase family protein [Bacillota bacterium]